MACLLIFAGGVIVISRRWNETLTTQERCHYQPQGKNGESSQIFPIPRKDFLPNEKKAPWFSQNREARSLAATPPKEDDLER
jgi:hypothetical protein